MAMTVAKHGQYSRINTINANADAGVKSGLPVTGDGVVIRDDRVESVASSSPA